MLHFFNVNDDTTDAQQTSKERTPTRQHARTGRSVLVAPVNLIIEVNGD
jgi:hypothetical protein